MAPFGKVLLLRDYNEQLALSLAFSHQTRLCVRKIFARRGVSPSLTMLVCPRTSLLRAFGRLGMLGVVGKELDVQMSPDNVP